MEFAAMATGIEGAKDIAEGTETLNLASEVASEGAAELAQEASNLTRAVDMELVPGRVAQLSDLVAAHGVQDVIEVAEEMEKKDKE